MFSSRYSHWQQLPTLKRQAVTTTTDHHSVAVRQVVETHSAVDLQPSAAVEITNKKLSEETQMKAWPLTHNS